MTRSPGSPAWHLKYHCRLVLSMNMPWVLWPPIFVHSVPCNPPCPTSTNPGAHLSSKPLKHSAYYSLPSMARAPRGQGLSSVFLILSPGCRGKNRPGFESSLPKQSTGLGWAMISSDTGTTLSPHRVVGKIKEGNRISGPSLCMSLSFLLIYISPW